ncbi:hypothetical protein KRR26_34415 [Corallococcus sp. M34]|uniref:hypothetical protein n=1 Tax=Citreicoccus inhibens TaxID=2849499 RepID=UPI001C213559|nr:hypothetical protein [Citreicoccus inhibens]MBU8900713.1 hypothetical protein [Citreicoccus inhibens]
MDLLRHLQPAPAPQRPPGVTCEDYVRSEDTRGLQYLPRGVCVLASGSVCTDWPRVSRHAPLRPSASAELAPVPALSPVESSQARVVLFGHPLLGAGGKKLAPAPFAMPSQPAARLVAVKEPGAPVAEAPSAFLRGLTDEAVASFKALGAEVGFASETCGEARLAPAYATQGRKELTLARDGREALPR